MIFLTKHNPWKNYNYHICLIYELNYNKPSNYLNNNIDIKLKLKKKNQTNFSSTESDTATIFRYLHTTTLFGCRENGRNKKKHDPIAISHNT